MKTELSRQIYLFIIFTLNGSFIGMLFDFFRIIRKSFKNTDFITSMQDILFCILTGVLLIYTIFIFNNGEIRLYVIAGISMGILLYMLLLSKHIIRISVKIITFLKKYIIKLLCIIFAPFKMIISIIKKTCILIFINIKKYVKKY